ncbi:MAG: hypothetical protein WCZ12_02055 [Patescibacteria group bacterium]
MNKIDNVIIKESNQLKTLGINHLKAYFSSSKDQDLIKQKFSNISGKTGQYFVPDKLFQKRTARKNRALIPFEHVVKSKLTYDQLNTFEGGVAVEFVNNDYFDQLDLPEFQQNLVFKKLKNKLGSNDNVSAIINIRGTGDSSSQVQRAALERLEEFLKKNNQKVEDVLLRRDSRVDYSGQGNDKWKGYVYYSIKGGQQDARDSHDDHGILSKDVQLFNPSVEYAGLIVSDDITLVLIYFAMFSVPNNLRNDKWKDLITKYLNYFSTRMYGDRSLKDYVINHISLKLKDGELIDPIQVRPIHIKDFAIKNREEDSLDITHQASVNRYSYVWDKGLGILLTAARPTNLFWSKHLSNMMQQDFSLKEYFIRQREILVKWDKYGIDKLDE